VEQNREPRSKAMNYSQVIPDKGAKKIHWGKDNIFNKGFWGNWKATCRKNEIGPLSLKIYQNELKLIKNLNVKTRIYETTRRKYKGNTSGC
jgi:hypothetical protein